MLSMNVAGQRRASQVEMRPFERIADDGAGDKAIKRQRPMKEEEFDFVRPRKVVRGSFEIQSFFRQNPQPNRHVDKEATR